MAALLWFVGLYMAIVCVIHVRGQTTEEPPPCQRSKLADENIRFLDADGSRRLCSPGFVYEQRHCGCTTLIAGGPLADREPDVSITFVNNTIRDINNRVWVENTGVVVSSEIEGSLDGFVGVFEGRPLKIPFFTNIELGAQFQVEIRFLQTVLNTARTTALLSNSESLTEGSVFIGITNNFNPQENTTSAFLDTGVNGVLNIATPTGWNTITMRYDPTNEDPPFVLSVESADGLINSVSAELTGNIVVTNSSMIIGAASSGQVNFFGYIDHIKIWKSGFL